MLYVYHHKVTGELLLRFDAEGREEILNSLKWAVKELDHEFLLPDTELTAGLSLEWQPCDFVNIMPAPNAEEPLRISIGIEITGGSSVLAALGSQLSALPENVREIILDKSGIRCSASLPI